MQFRKMKLASLEIDSIYVAYSARNKRLSVNGDKGVFVKLIEKNAGGVKVQVLGTQDVTGITRLEDREDCWMYDASGSHMQVAVKRDVNVGPAFSPRMIAEGWDGKVFEWDEGELYTNEREGEAYYNIPLLRHKGETINPATEQAYVNNFNMSCVFPVNPPEWRIPRALRMGIGAVVLPLPPKPVAQPDNDALLEKCIPYFAELNQNQRENVSFMKVNEDFSKKEQYLNQVCHARLQRDEKFKVKYVLTYGLNRNIDVYRWAKGHCSEEAQRLYITYLTNYSPYADVFITKDVDYILEHGYILDADGPSRLVVGACYATRQMWEKSERAEGFLELYKAGIPLDVAFVFGCQCSQYGKGKIKFAQSGDNHSHLNHQRLSDKCILNFIEHSPQYPGVPYSEDSRASGRLKDKNDFGVDGMWSNDYYNKHSKMFKTLLDIKKKGGGRFPGDDLLPIDDAVEMAVDAIEDWLRKNGV